MSKIYQRLPLFVFFSYKKIHAGFAITKDFAIGLGYESCIIYFKFLFFEITFQWRKKFKNKCMTIGYILDNPYSCNEKILLK